MVGFDHLMVALLATGSKRAILIAGNGTAHVSPQNVQCTGEGRLAQKMRSHLAYGNCERFEQTTKIHIRFILN